MAGHKGQLRLRQVPAVASDMHWCVLDIAVHGGILWCLRPGVMAAVGVSVLHVCTHNPAFLLHGLHLRGDQQGRRAGVVEPGVQRISAGGLFRLAAETR